MTEANAPYVLDPKPGVVYTPREAREAIILYRSAMENVHDADTPEEGNQILRDLADCGFGYKELEDVPNPNRMIIRPMLVSMDKAAERHDRCIAMGMRGGRPRLELDRQTLEQDYNALGSWEKVAEKHGVSRKTLYNERARWEEGDLGKNLNNTNKKTNKNTFTNKTARPAERSDAQSAGVSEKAKKQMDQALKALRKYQEQQKQENGAEDAC